MSPRGHATVDVLGVPISAIDLPAAVAELGNWIANGAREYVTVTNVHFVMEAQRDPALFDVAERAGMVTPDGMPMVWSCRWAGQRHVNRVYGPDLVQAAASAGVEPGWSHYFYGGLDGAADDLAARLAADNPGLRVAGTNEPPFRADVAREDDDVIDRINRSGADIVWVGMSCPKQERWMALNRDAIDAPVLVGVGAAFDLLTGRVKQAPRWMQRSGFEWLYRLAREPRRLARRYLRTNPRFVTSIVRRPPRQIGRQ